MFQSPTSDFTWTINHKSAYNYDNGLTYLILRHKLVTPIYYDDVITFGISFSSEVDADAKAVDDATFQGIHTADYVIDQARCTIEINTRDDNTWLITNEDGYVYLDSVELVNVYDIDDQEDWDDYLEDDDSDNPFCSWNSADTTTLFANADLQQWNTPYQCT